MRQAFRLDSGFVGLQPFGRSAPKVVVRVTGGERLEDGVGLDHGAV